MVFKKRLIHPMEALNLLHQQELELREMEQWAAAKVDEQRKLSKPPAVKRTWERPPFRVVKFNCYGAWSKGMGGFGWVARDFTGILKAAGGVGKYPCVSSLVAEAEAEAEVEAVRAAVGVCVEHGFRDVHRVGF
ncbi:hypothetical protein COP2_047556 [Malus domestica]